MFVKISNINYYVNPENKSATEIYYELFTRMNVHSIPTDQKIQMIESIKEQLAEKMLSDNVYKTV